MLVDAVQHCPKKLSGTAKAARGISVYQTVGPAIEKARRPYSNSSRPNSNASDSNSTQS